MSQQTNKPSPNDFVHPQPVHEGSNGVEPTYHWTGEGGLRVREHAFLLAWQANLIATAMKAPVNPHAAVRALFGEPEPRQHVWERDERPGPAEWDSRGAQVRCRVCGTSVGQFVSADGLSKLASEAAEVNAAIERGETEPCPGRPA